MKAVDTLKLVLSIAVCELAGFIGSFFTIPSIPGWYATLARPELAPPNWVFGPVWTTLFALMGIAAFLIWKKGISHKPVRSALWVFLIQLVLNACWTIIFFGLHSPGIAFAEIVILWVAILGTIILFARISRAAAWLLLPYILWVSFAAYLNFSIWTLNS
jgi:benzodiazapine receptor